MPSARTKRRGAFLYSRFAENGIQNASRSLVASFALMSLPDPVLKSKSSRDPGHGFGEARLEDVHAVANDLIARGERHEEADNIPVGPTGEENKSVIVGDLHQSLGQ